MDKLVRKIIDKTTGLPISRAIVKARPKDVGAAGDIDMAEIGATGTYATAAEVPHNTYGIIVNGTDSLDEATPEPGRVGVTKADGTKVYPLIDRVLDSKVTLSSFLADGDSSPTSSTLLTAIAAATGSKPRTLVLDADVSLDSASSVSGNDLNLDLNGHLLTLSTVSSSITSGTRRIRVFNGRIQVSNVNCRIQGTGTNFSMVQFSGTMTAFARNDGDMTFDGCDGLSALVGANLSGSISSVGSGSHGFGTASQLKLTTQGSTAGNGRLVKLQSFVDGWYDNLVGYIHTAANWLDATRRSALQEWIDIPSANRAAITGFTNSVPLPKSDAIAKFTASQAERSAGIKTGIRKITTAGGYAYASGCVKATYYTDGYPPVLALINKTALIGVGVKEDLAKLFLGDGNSSHFRCWVINANGAREPVVFHVDSVQAYSEQALLTIGFYSDTTPIPKTSSGVSLADEATLYIEFDIINEDLADTNFVTTSR